MSRVVCLLIAVGLMLSPEDSLAVETSCDLITGASCIWKEGCDCDGDGFVVSNNEKYCHYEECPLDADDRDPDVLGKPSKYNKDGDAWTVKYDCNDKNPCIDKNCVEICVDEDGDGHTADLDCDDENPFVFPYSPIPCCACDVILNVDKRADFSCGAPPCPYDELNPPPDGLGSPVDGSTLESDASSTDANGMASGKDDAIFLPPMDSRPNHFAGSGRAPDHPAGCAVGNTNTQHPISMVFLIAVLLLSMLLRAWLTRTHPKLCPGLRSLVWWVAVFGLLLSACQTVRPWQREQLAKAPMTFDPDPLENQLEQHFLQYRESATGGFGGSGGGCGCN